MKLVYIVTIIICTNEFCYRIYIPVNTWHFRIDIWGCNFTLKFSQHVKEPCISSSSLKGRALPIYNHSDPSPIGNISSMDQYTYYESSPYEDSYYYLMIVSNSVVDFNIKVTVIGKLPFYVSKNKYKSKLFI